MLARWAPAEHSESQCWVSNCTWLFPDGVGGCLNNDDMVIVLFHSYTFVRLCHVHAQVNIFSCPEKHLLLKSSVFLFPFDTECSPPNQKTTQRRWSGFLVQTLQIRNFVPFISISQIFTLNKTTSTRTCWFQALPQCDKLACRYGAPHAESGSGTPNRMLRSELETKCFTAGGGAKGAIPDKNDTSNSNRTLKDTKK